MDHRPPQRPHSGSGRRKKKKERILNTVSVPPSSILENFPHPSKDHPTELDTEQLLGPRVVRRATASDAGGQAQDVSMAVGTAFSRPASTSTPEKLSSLPANTTRDEHFLPSMTPVLERDSGNITPTSRLTRQPSLSFTPPSAAPSSTAAAPPTPTTGTTAAAATAGTVLSSTVTGLPSFLSYLSAEANPAEKYPTADVVWRQTERDRVYNYLLYVPYQLERVMIFGTCLCLWSFLGSLTLLPLRVLRACYNLVCGPPAAGSTCRVLPGHQLYDCLCCLLVSASVCSLLLIRPGVIYYWMKDVTSEFLRIQVLFTALEMLDKILANFGVDVLEALSSSCTLYSRRSITIYHLASDMVVAFAMISLHGAVLMCQAIVFAVAMNSKRHALLALLIASNFVEIKGTVNKRTDTNKLWTLVCQDIVERFHLLLVLSFVVMEDVINSGGWLPAVATVVECGRIFSTEVIIDVIKHAVLGKFNDIRPGIYREYMRDLCEDSLDKHSHNVHKLTGFCPLGPAALALRMVVTLVRLRTFGQIHWALTTAVGFSLWVLCCLWQVILGYCLKWVAHSYMHYWEVQSAGKPQPRVIKSSVTGERDVVHVKVGAAGMQSAGGAGGAAGLIIPPFHGGLQQQPSLGGHLARQSPPQQSQQQQQQNGMSPLGSVTVERGHKVRSKWE